MRKGSPIWKVFIAALSLIITILVWQQGLQQSFDRPSVTPKLVLNQREKAVLAAPVIPDPFKSVLVGEEPLSALGDALLDIPIDRLEDRQRLVLASIEKVKEKRISLLEGSLKDDDLLPVQQILLQASLEPDLSIGHLEELQKIKKDPLLYQTACFAIGAGFDSCVDETISRAIAIRLGVSQAFPFFAVIAGLGLLIRQAWSFARKENFPWPATTPLPLTLLDMTLLIAGGFVVCGVVVLPALIDPVVTYALKGLKSPLNESVKVLVRYSFMTMPPLLILRQQLRSLSASERPDTGWMQWNFRPLPNALFLGFRGWLMAMPPVLLTGWIMNSLVGDQGGSNPLLDLVLNSQNATALLLLLITTVVLAPLFEELVFRGALLPVLVQKVGGFWALLVSAFIFAMAHLSASEFPPLFVLGVGLALLRMSSGRLFPCVFMHSLWNGVTFVNLLLLG